ncbi:MAG: hypothetical protein KY476_01475 [Planctomycetes bacterium]|nr:hypothetical protein [Planctomycetota bacterium]
MWLCGCGGPQEERPALQPAQGSLFINGKPAEGAMLVLHRADGKNFDARGTRPRATVGADGSFEVTTYQGGDGAPPGDYQVAVMWLDDPDSSTPWDKLGDRYSDPKQTGIRISIEEGESQLDPIRIEKVRIFNRPPSGTANDYDQVD